MGLAGSSNEVIGAQIIYVPADEVLQASDSYSILIH